MKLKRHYYAGWILALGGLNACYSGLEFDGSGLDGEGAGGQGSADGESGARGAGGPNGEVGGFDVPRESVQMLAFEVRRANLVNLVGLASDSPVLAKLDANATRLGKADFAAGITLKLDWTAEAMGAWVEAVQPVCRSDAWRETFPNMAQDPTALLREVLAREPDAAYYEVVDEIVATAPAGSDVEELICLAVLSSCDFVAQ